MVKQSDSAKKLNWSERSRGVDTTCLARLASPDRETAAMLALPFVACSMLAVIFIDSE